MGMVRNHLYAFYFLLFVRVVFPADSGDGLQHLGVATHMFRRRWVLFKRIIARSLLWTAENARKMVLFQEFTELYKKLKKKDRDDRSETWSETGMELLKRSTS